MRRLVVIPLLVLAVLASARSANSAVYVWHWTSNSTVKNTCPCCPGSAWNDSTTARPPALALGDTLWVAVCNDVDPDREKFMSLDLYNDPNNTDFHYQIEGFLTDDTSQPVTVKEVVSQLFGAIGLWSTQLDFTPQPRWERVAITPNPGSVVQPPTIANPLRIVRIGTICVDKDSRWSPPFLQIVWASFGSTGNMATVPNFREVWVFPETGVIGAGAPTFTTTPVTGPWAHATVAVDPEGHPRPGGGMKFTSTGLGLTTGDRFNCQVPVDGTNAYRYDLYARDLSTGNYEKYVLDLAPVGLPGASTQGIAALLAALFACGGLALLRRRAARS